MLLLRRSGVITGNQVSLFKRYYSIPSASPNNFDKDQWLQFFATLADKGYFLLNE